MGRAALILIAAAALLAAATASVAQAADPLEAMGVLRPAAPTPAPDVALRTLDGRQARLAEFRGKPVILGFFTTW